MAKITGASVASFRDRELIWKIYDLSEESGWVSTQSLSEEMAKLINTDYPSRNIGSRLAWMKRIGYLESTRDKGCTLWRLTRAGHLYRLGDLDSEVASLLQGASGGELLEAMRIIATRSMRDSIARIAVRREYRTSEARARR